MFGSIGGKGGGQKTKRQNAILSDNWNVGLMFGGQLHLSAKRHSFSSRIRTSVLLEQHVELGFCEVPKVRVNIFLFELLL